MEVYFNSSSVLQSSHSNFYDAILKLKVKSEKMVDYSTPPKKVKRSLFGLAINDIDVYTKNSVNYYNLGIAS